MRVSSPSSSRTRSALAQVCRAWPYCWLSVVMDGVGMPGASFPAAMSRRVSAARRTYALGSDSSLIDILAPYSIGNIANRNASTLVDDRRRTQKGVIVRTWQGRDGPPEPIPRRVMIMYSWTALSGDTSAAVVG